MGNPLEALEVHHVGVAVSSLAGARDIYRSLFAMGEGGRDEVPSQGVRLEFFCAGRSKIELLEPTRGDSPLSKFLSKRGPGLHHVAYRVASIDAALEDLRRRGVRLVDETARPGAHGTRIAFLHPSATGGVLTELVEDPRA